MSAGVGRDAAVSGPAAAGVVHYAPRGQPSAPCAQWQQRVMVAVAQAPIVIKVEQGAVEMVGDVSTVVSVAVQESVDESRIVVTRTISVAGALISVVLLMVAAVLLWFIRLF